MERATSRPTRDRSHTVRHGTHGLTRERIHNNWETLVRRARGYRDHDYLLRKLRFMVANPIRTNDGIRRFVALGLTPPMPLGQAA